MPELLLLVSFTVGWKLQKRVCWAYVENAVRESFRMNLVFIFGSYFYLALLFYININIKNL